MRVTKMAAIVGGAVVLAGTAGGVAIATSGNSDPEDAIIADAAKTLNVTPKQLHDALKSAEDNQLDQAVKDGKLTQKQADAIKARQDHVLGVGGPGGGTIHRFPGGPGFGPTGPGGPGFGPPGGFHGGPGFGPGPMMGGPFGDAVDAVAKLLGVSKDDLFTALRKGTKLSDYAKAHGHTLDDVKATVKDAAKTDLDKAVKDGKLTQAQEDEILSHVGDMVDHINDGGFPGPPTGRKFGGGRIHRFQHP